MNQVVTDAIVLRRINYQEADRIITYLTSDHGKITSIAKGSRKANSKLAGSIELFGISKITFLPGRGEMSMLISARLVSNFSNIVKDYKRTQFGYEILKLINKNIEVIGDQTIYKLLLDTLAFLDEVEISLEITKFWFILQFLVIMGHTPNLDVETDLENNNFFFEVDTMKFTGDDNGPYNRNHIKLFRLALLSNPRQLAKVINVDKIIDKSLGLAQIMLVGNGYNPL